MATYITKRCGRCGFKQTISSYGHINDPIGIRVARCPACNNLSKESKTKEWVQMKPFKRYMAINPRCIYRVVFFGLFLSAFLCIAFIGPDSTEPVPAPLLFGLYFLSVALLHYLFTILKLNSKVFQKRYCNSILRSRNPSYRKMLQQEGPIYDEGIPSWIYCSKATRQKLDDYIRQNSANTNFRVPTFMETIHNEL